MSSTHNFGWYEIRIVKVYLWTIDNCSSNLLYIHDYWVIREVMSLEDLVMSLKKVVIIDINNISLI